MPLNIAETEFVKFMEDYSKKIDYLQKSSWSDPKTCYKEMLNGYEKHFMKFSSGNDVDGILCVNIDHTCQTEFRAYIRHMTVIDRSKYADALAVATEFIWNSLYADTIRLDLHHFKPEGEPTGTLGTDNEIKVALGMAKKGFKWKTLINDPTGKRF